MNPRIEKLKSERARVASRIEAWQEKLKKLDDQILRLENTDIVGIVRETGLTIDQLANLMELRDRMEQRKNDPAFPTPVDYAEEEKEENEE